MYLLFKLVSKMNSAQNVVMLEKTTANNCPGNLNVRR